MTGPAASPLAPVTPTAGPAGRLTARWAGATACWAGARPTASAAGGAGRRTAAASAMNACRLASPTADARMVPPPASTRSYGTGNVPTP